MAMSDWNMNDRSNDGTKIEYLSLKQGIYRVRLLKNPVKFAKYFHEKDGRSRFAVIDVSTIDSCPVKAKHPDLQKASIRYGVRVIDRNDNGKIKVMEFPYTVYQDICNQSKHNKVNPGDATGADFVITVTGIRLAKKYVTIFDGINTLEKDEIKLFKSTEDNINLEKIFKVDSYEDVEKKLFGDFSKHSNEDSLNTPITNVVDESFGSDSSSDDVSDDEVPF